MTLKPWWLRLGSAALSGGFYALAFSLHPLWWAAWIAPVLLLIAAFSTEGGEIWGLAMVAGLIGASSQFSYELEILGAPLAILFTVLQALGLALATRVSTGALSRLPSPLAVFAFPVMTAAIDLLQRSLSSGGAYGSGAYSQMDFLPAVQVAALGGTPAVVFIVSLFGAAVAIAVARGARIGRPAVTYGLALVVLIGAGGYGARRLLRPAVTETVSVALIASDRYPGPKTPWPAAWAEYAPAIDTAAGKGARLVVLPEEIARLSSAEFPAAAASAAEAADRNRVGLLIGLRMVDGRKTFNRAIGFGPSGQTAVYAKQQLVPGFEAMITPGHADKVLPGDPPRTGIAICRDMDYPALARRYAALGAGLMLVPAWDFGRDGWQHSRMAILRGVEDGFTLVRSARGGLMTVSDRYGRVLAQAPSAPHTATLMAAAPLDGRGPAFYARAGDLFGWACVFGAAAFILSAMRRPRPVAPPLA